MPIQLKICLKLKIFLLLNQKLIRNCSDKRVFLQNQFFMKCQKFCIETNKVFNIVKFSKLSASYQIICTNTMKICF